MVIRASSSWFCGLPKCLSASCCLRRFCPLIVRSFILCIFFLPQAFFLPVSLSRGLHLSLSIDLLLAPNEAPRAQFLPSPAPGHLGISAVAWRVVERLSFCSLRFKSLWSFFLVVSVISVSKDAGVRVLFEVRLDFYKILALVSCAARLSVRTTTTT